jgi:hypothetical protein
MNEKYLTAEKGKYYFQDRLISRRQYQKIKYGNWAALPPEKILDKLHYKELREQRKEGYEIVYEGILNKPLGQYCLGIAQEKVANDIIRIAKRLKNEGRRTVKTSKGKLLDQNTYESERK